jgi:hypothetical protein
MIKLLWLCLSLWIGPGHGGHSVNAVAGAALDGLEQCWFATEQDVNTSASLLNISWDPKSLTRVSDKRFRYSSYARVIQLHDGSLLCIYEADGSIMAAKSRDSGRTWGQPRPVAWKVYGTNMAAPDVIELNDHSLLACYNPRPYKISGSRCFGIRTRISRDGGRTWKHGRLVYEAGHKFQDGCWEPSAIQLPSGEIQLYFADENPYRHSSEQNISLVRSFDGGFTWTARPEVAGFRAGGRDGMPSPLALHNGKEIALAIEDSGWFGYLQPAVLRTSTTSPWRRKVAGLSPNRAQEPDRRVGFWHYAGAPCLRQVSTGETLLSYQGTEGRRNHMRTAEMKVAIGDQNARNFRLVNDPFPIPPNCYGLWNSLAVLKDDTVIAVTTTNAFSPNPQVWMIKGKIMREPSQAKQVSMPDSLRRATGYLVSSSGSGTSFPVALTVGMAVCHWRYLSLISLASSFTLSGCCAATSLFSPMSVLRL